MVDDPSSRRANLLGLRAQTADQLAAISAMLERLQSDRAGANDDDEHDPDGAPLSAEWSRLTGQADAARSKLQQIDDALDRLDAGSYGVCEICSTQIPPGRLEVRPFATHCVPCAERLTR